MPLIGEEALRKTYSRFMKDNPFKGLLEWFRPENQTYLVLAAVVVVIFVWLAKSKDSSTVSPPSSNTCKSPSLLVGIEELFRQQQDSLGG
jgi:hypothetical protein